MSLDIKELRNMTVGELAEKEKQLVQELFNLRFQFGTGRLENPMQIRKTKRDIARVKTVLQQGQGIDQTEGAKG
ncbi:MAG: 50S ribosomal protein L29 [Nitrospira sp.]|nr:50S ribosomal protein L29 [Nitrospira sp.]MDH4371005.1 50S ribosomal protein L29 [Nitrospira sp.]MDH5347445.1 50S ribosomal protein L29 [Nitrospira sp.]MDH5497371.1 50S ribosomal protein L29 [Nitrospira sp.]MDH5725676.1 50S ribosomal protein L29 [Nitrospira sp.]